MMVRFSRYLRSSVGTSGTDGIWGLQLWCHELLCPMAVLKLQATPGTRGSSLNYLPSLVFLRKAQAWKCTGRSYEKNTALVNKSCFIMVPEIMFLIIFQVDIGFGFGNSNEELEIKVAKTGRYLQPKLNQSPENILFDLYCLVLHSCRKYRNIKIGQRNGA